MSSLEGISSRNRHTLARTHSVVKFMVNVKLVEKSVNSHVGREIEVKVISQKRRPGITLTKSSIKWPTQPSHDLGGKPSGVVASADAWAIAVLVALPMTEPSALAFTVKLPVEGSMLYGYAPGRKVHAVAASLRMRLIAELEVGVGMAEDHLV